MTTPSTPSPVSGHLMKQSPNPLRRGAYQLRYVEIKDGIISWSTPGGKEKGRIDLRLNSVIVHADPNCESRFTLQSVDEWKGRETGASVFTGDPKSREFLFDAAHHGIKRDDWVKAIQSHSAGLQSPTPRTRSDDTVDPRAAQAMEIAKVSSFDEFSAIGNGCSIAKTEERAITLPQLRAVWAHIQRRCLQEEWLGGPNSDLPTTPDAANLYVTNKFVILPATCGKQCSFVEFVASAPQPPCWFVSHWWGEPVKDFVACLEVHAEDHLIGTWSESEERKFLPDPKAAYWVCAYANNQWDLSGSVTEDPSQTSFRKAIDLAQGTVSVFDPNGVVFTRIWCSYEIFVSLQNARDDYKWEVYTAFPHTPTLFDRSKKDVALKTFEREAVGITDGVAPFDQIGVAKEQRERHFPFLLAKQALSIQLESAQASVDSDRTHILNAIIGSQAFNAPAPISHPSFNHLDEVLRGRVAASALRLAIKNGSRVQIKKGSCGREYEAKSDFDEEAMPAFFEALLRSKLTKLDLQFMELFEFTVDVAQNLMSHLPPELLSLKCNYLLGEGPPGVRGQGIAEAFANHLAKNPTLRELDIGGNGNVGSYGLLAIAEALRENSNLMSLNLNGSMLQFKPTFEDIDGEVFEMCMDDSDDAGLMALADTLRSNPSLKLLDIRGNHIQADALAILKDAWDIYDRDPSALMV